MRKRKAKQATHITGSSFKKSITDKVRGPALKKLNFTFESKSLKKTKNLY